MELVASKSTHIQIIVIQIGAIQSMIIQSSSIQIGSSSIHFSQFQKNEWVKKKRMIRNICEERKELACEQPHVW